MAPSGGRLDEIIRAVRDCPSGRPQLRDRRHRGARPGRLGERQGAGDRGDQGRPVSHHRRRSRWPARTAPSRRRAEGASREHYALCRCGQSQNKPFCSGMHWYVDFHDPVPAEGNEPSPYEWAGGLTALTRMCRLFYEKHVPGRPAARAAACGHPAGPGTPAGRLAGRALGGPAADAARRRRAAGGHRRGRWRVRRASSGPGGSRCCPPRRTRPRCRPTRSSAAVLSSCLEWASRTALADVPGRPEPQQVPVPRWDWGPAGPPAPPEPRTQRRRTAAAAAELPGPDQPVSFAAHIKPLFRERDRQSMSFAFDLWSFEDVSSRAAGILSRLSGTARCPVTAPGPPRRSRCSSAGRTPAGSPDPSGAPGRGAALAGHRHTGAQRGPPAWRAAPLSVNAGLPRSRVISRGRCPGMCWR